MHLILTIQNQNSLVLELKQDKKVIDHEGLTINHGFDTLLIRAIDKLLARNKIDRLLLKSLKIRGEIEDGAVSSMIVRTIKTVLGA